MINQALIPTINRFHARKENVSRDNVGYDQAKDIGILYSYPDPVKSSAISELIGKLKEDGKTANSIFLIDPKKTDSGGVENCFFDSHIKLFGKWINPIVPKFYERKFDYLLHLDEDVSPLIENVLLKSQALCRIGMYNESHKHLYEMMIKTADGANLSFQMMEIYSYLKQLR